MSEEQRITKVEKEKDPRRVASGKRLAAVSKMAKEKKAQERQRMECTDGGPAEDAPSGGYSVITIIAGVGVLSGLGCLYLKYRQDKRAQEATKSNTNTQPDDSRPSRSIPSRKPLTLD